MASTPNEDAQIPAAIGSGVPSSSMPTMAVIAAAARNWMKPSTEEAVPAACAKGEIAPVAIAGFMKA